MKILKQLKNIFKPRAYSIYIASDYTTITSNGEVLVYEPSVLDEKIKCFAGYQALRYNKNVIRPIRQDIIFNCEAALRMLQEFTRKLPFTKKTVVRVAVPAYAYVSDCITMFEVFEYFCGSNKVLTIPSAIAAYYELKSIYNIKETILLIDISSDVTYLSILSAHNILVCSFTRFGWDNLREVDDDEWHKSIALRVSYFLSQTFDSYESAFLICNDKSKTDELIKLSTYLPIDVIIPQDFHHVICRGIEKAQNENSEMFHPLLLDYQYLFVRTFDIPIKNRDLLLFQMQNIEDRYKSNFEPHSLDKPLKIIATSGSAINALSLFCEKKKEASNLNADFVALYCGFLDKDVNIPNILTINWHIVNECSNSGDYTMLYPIFDAIIGFYTHEVLLIHTVGSRTAYRRKWPDVFVQYLHSKGIKTTLLTTTPYAFEGRYNRITANKHLFTLYNLCDKVEYANSYSITKGQKVTWENAYKILDEAICKKIETILSVSTETDRDKRLNRKLPKGIITLNRKSYKKTLE